MKPNQDRSKIKRKLQKLKRQDRTDDMIDCATIEDYEVPLLPEELPKPLDPYEYNPSEDEAESEKISSDTVRSRSSSAMLQSSESQLSIRRSIDSFMGNPREQSIVHQGYHIGTKDTCWVCNASKSNLTILSALPNNNLQLAGANSQGSDVWAKFFALMKDGVSKFFLLIFKVLGYLLDNPTSLLVLFGLLSLYFVLLYLELSLATLIELSAQTVWPTSHIFLRGMERFFKLLSAFLGQMDDLGQAVYCDLAEHWCKRFGMMCADKCSFVDMAVNKLR